MKHRTWILISIAVILVVGFVSAQVRSKKMKETGTGPVDFTYNCEDRTYIPTDDRSWAETWEGFSTDRFVWHYGYHELRDAFGLDDAQMDYYVNSAIWARSQENGVLYNRQIEVWLVGQPHSDEAGHTASFMAAVKRLAVSYPAFIYEITVDYDAENGVTTLHELSEAEFASCDPSELYYYTEYDALCDRQGIEEVQRRGLKEEDYTVPVYNVLYDAEGKILTPGVSEDDAA